MILRCREAGVPATPQRIAVYRALLESEDHPTPEALFRRVRPVMPSLSLATIYKTLETLRRIGVAREVSMPGSGRRWDANMERHHHLACVRCRAMTDYDNPDVDAAAPPRLPGGFVPLDVSVQILGFCAACARAEKARHRKE